MAAARQIGLSDAGLRLVIVADDLTGALDAAAPFADRGLVVRVATHGAALDRAAIGADVVAVSTRSREIAPDAARAAVASVLARVPAGVALFKKVDSRLKGNIAAELAAFPDGPVLAVPALPEFGRVVRGGVVSGWGVDRPISVADAIGRAATVPDVVTPDDMRVALSNVRGALIVGARSAALALAEQMAAGQPTLPRLLLPLLVAVGSTDPITLAQVTALREGLPGLRYLPAPDGQADVVPSPGVTLVQAVPGVGEVPATAVAAALAATVAGLVRGAATVLLTGGATAEAVLDALAMDVLDLHGDVFPGLPVSTCGDLTIVTKSGGFGDADVLLRLAVEAGT